MKSLLYAARELKLFAKNKKYLIIYGAGYFAVRCKNLLDNCHIHTDYFVITGNVFISENDGENQIENVPVKKLLDFPYADDMTPDNTGVVVAVNEKYLKEIRENLKGAGLWDVYEFSNQVKTASVGITTRVGCAVACEYCPQSVFLENYQNIFGREYKRVLTLNEFQKCLNHIPKMVQINFAGFSEPFLNPECKDMILHAYERGHYIEIYTTLMGMTEDMADEIFDKAMFVIHLPDEDNRTNIVIDDAYICCLKRIFELNQREKRILRISAPLQVSRKLLPYIPDDVKIQKELCDRAGNVEGAPGISVSGRVSCIRTYQRLDRNVMLPNGALLLCCNDWGLKNILGNLKEETWADIIDGDIANQIREDMLSGRKELICHSCNFAMELED